MLALQGIISSRVTALPAERVLGCLMLVHSMSARTIRFSQPAFGIEQTYAGFSKQNSNESSRVRAECDQRQWVDAIPTLSSRVPRACFEQGKMEYRTASNPHAGKTKQNSNETSRVRAECDQRRWVDASPAASFGAPRACNKQGKAGHRTASFSHALRDFANCVKWAIMMPDQASGKQAKAENAKPTGCLLDLVRISCIRCDPANRGGRLLVESVRLHGSFRRASVAVRLEPRGELRHRELAHKMLPPG